MKSLKISAILFVFFLLYSCTPEVKEVRLTPALPETSVKSAEKMGWETEWENSIGKAKKEGKVVIYSNLPTKVGEELTRGFQEKFNIALDFTLARSEQTMQKILFEKRAGLNIVDVHIGGDSTADASLKPAGMLEDLRNHLLLPEVTDPNVWFEKRLPFYDVEGKYILSSNASVARPSTFINTNLVKAGEVTSFYDFLDPKWKGKIIMDDPTARTGTRRFITRPLFVKTLDWDYWKAFVKQEPLIIRNERLLMEWVSRGRYPILAQGDSDLAPEFISLGVPIKLVSLKEIPGYIKSGGGSLNILINPPHLNASKVFLNWFLSREGQTIFARAHNAQSARVDGPVDHLQAVYGDNIRDLNTKYHRDDLPEFVRFEKESRPIIEEIFGSLTK